jgi:hypothetical protein
MKTISKVCCATAIVVGMAAPASAAQSDPEIIIYRFPGVRDNGGADNTGVATVFQCSNFSGAVENIRLVTRNNVGTLLRNDFQPVGHLQTLTVSTHIAAAYSGVSFPTGLVDSGTTAIAATSTNIVCTAMAIDAANSKPDGVALRGIRFSPVPGSQE